MRRIDFPRLLGTFGIAAFLAGATSAQCDPQKVFSTDSAIFDYFGKAVAIDGDTAVVGAYSVNNERPGFAYVFDRGPAGWVKTACLTPSDGGSSDQFGNWVGISGDRVIVGAEFHDSSFGNNSGAAYVYERTGGVWSEVAKLLPSDAQKQHNFAENVAISGDNALIGVRFDSDNGNNSGAAYFFRRIGDTWTETQKVVAGDAERNALYGDAVALDGDVAVVGSWRKDGGKGLNNCGAAYVLERIGGTWVETARLTPSDARAGAEFGRSVGIQGTTLVVGAWNDSALGSNRGKAYVYEKLRGVWTETAVLTDPLGSTDARFGFSSDVDGDTVVVGSRFDAVVGLRSGSVNVFRRGAAGWEHVRRIIPTDAAPFDEFGHAVAVSRGTVLIGAPFDRGQRGGAYLYPVDECTTPLGAAFSATPTSGKSPLTVRFQDDSSGAPLAWSWDFGDGTTSTEAAPVHVYDAVGRYTVTLTVKDGDGGTSTLTLPDLVEVEAPVAALLVYGCGVNPTGSMQVLAGDARLGTVVSLGLDNPLGTQAPGSIPLLALTFQADGNYPCGRLVNGLGMAGPGAPGELLIALQPAPFRLLTGGAWAGPGNPARIDVAIPGNTNLIGREIFAQGRLVDPTPGAAIPVGITDAVRITIQP